MIETKVLLKTELQKHEYAEFHTMLFISRLNGYRDKKGGSVMACLWREEYNNISDLCVYSPQICEM